MDLEEERGSLSRVVPQGTSVSGRVKTLCWVRVSVLCSHDAGSRCGQPVGPGCPPPDTTETALWVLVSSFRRQMHRKCRFQPEQGRSSVPFSCNVICALSAPVAIMCLSCGTQRVSCGTSDFQSAIVDSPGPSESHVTDVVAVPESRPRTPALSAHALCLALPVIWPATERPAAPVTHMGTAGRRRGTFGALQSRVTSIVLVVVEMDVGSRVASSPWGSGWSPSSTLLSRRICAFLGQIR